MKGDTIPSSIEIIRDQQTRNEIFRLTDSPGALTHHLYFTSPTFTKDMEWLVYGSDREEGGQFNLYKFRFSTFESIQVTEGQGIWTQGATIAPDGTEVFFSRDDNHIWAVDLETLEEREVWHMEEAASVGYLSASPDGQYLTFAFSRERLWEMGLSSQELVERFPRCGVGVVRTDGSEAWLAVDSNVLISHAQFCPGDDDLILYCHEGPWHRVQRMWLVHRDGTGCRPLCTQAQGEGVGHEFWADGGRMVYFTTYGGRAPQGLWTLNRGGGAPRCVLAGPTHAHGTASPDEDIFVVDECFGDRDHLWVAYQGSWQPRMLCQTGASWSNQKLHPHPRFLPTGKAVLFTSDRTGSAELYMVSV
jgi:oligogalacturonide lyase